MDHLQALHSLLVAFGPVGAFALLLIAGGAYFYRRDFLRERRNGERLTDVLARSVESNVKLALAVETLTDTLREQYARHEREFELLRAAIDGLRR